MTRVLAGLLLGFVLGCGEPLAPPDRPTFVQVELRQCRGDEVSPEACVDLMEAVPHTNTIYVAAPQWTGPGRAYLTAMLLWPYAEERFCPFLLDDEALCFAYGTWGPYEAGERTYQVDLTFDVYYVGLAYELRFLLTETPVGGEVYDQWSFTFPPTKARGEPTP